jgi:hypothetical protein
MTIWTQVPSTCSAGREEPWRLAADLPTSTDFDP